MSFGKQYQFGVYIFAVNQIHLWGNNIYSGVIFFSCGILFDYPQIVLRSQILIFLQYEYSGIGQY